ncbi:MAG: RES family NAD+ phosphorylase [Acidimicrobiales bacterium]
MTGNDLEFAVARAPHRILRGRFWHQGTTQRPLTSIVDPARSNGRYHMIGRLGVWYASNREQVAWAELFRHFASDAIDPFEVRRRVGHVDVDGLEVLDLTNASVRSSLGISQDDLVDDDYILTQRIAKFAAQRGFSGILGPSAAMDECTTLAVFPNGMSSVTSGPSHVRQPPPRMADLLHTIMLSG